MLRLLLIFCSGLFFATTSTAEKESYYVAVSDDDFLPYTWIEDGVFHGADRALLDAFATQQQLKLIYLPLPRHRALELMQSGVVDLIYPDDYYWAFAAKQGMELDYSDYGMTNHAGFFRLASAQCRADFSIIGAQRGWLPDGYQKKLDSGEVTLRHYTTLDQLLEAGRSGEVEAIFSERYFLGLHIERKPRYSDLTFCDNLPSSIGKLRLSTINHPDVLMKFNQFLTTQAEEIRAIRAQFRLP